MINLIYSQMTFALLDRLSEPYLLSDTYITDIIHLNNFSYFLYLHGYSLPSVCSSVYFLLSTRSTGVEGLSLFSGPLGPEICLNPCLAYISSSIKILLSV